MDAKAHLQQAEDNEQLAEFLKDTAYPDWTCTALFYACLHFVEAYFESRTPRVSAHNHGDRGSFIQLDDNIRIIYKDYHALQDDSQAARYHGWKPSRDQIEQRTIPAVRAIKKHLKQYVPSIMA